MAKVEVQGLDKLVGKLSTMGKKVHRRVMMKALTKSDKPLRDAMKRNAKGVKDTGAYAKSIGAKRKVSTSQFWAYSVVGPRKGVYGSKDGRDRRPAKYAHLIEFGYRKRGASGFVAGRPIMRQAWDTTRNNVSREMMNQIMAGIRAEAVK